MGSLRVRPPSAMGIIVSSILLVNVVMPGKNVFDRRSFLSAANATGICDSPDHVELRRPFAADGGYAYGEPLPQLNASADTEDNHERSKLILCENGKPLGPAHSVHDDIRTKGEGRYSHWFNKTNPSVSGIIFSTSDNSDPNTTSRPYWVIVDQ